MQYPTKQVTKLLAWALWLIATVWFGASLWVLAGISAANRANLPITGLYAEALPPKPFFWFIVLGSTLGGMVSLGVITLLCIRKFGLLERLEASYVQTHAGLLKRSPPPVDLEPGIDYGYAFAESESADLFWQGVAMLFLATMMIGVATIAGYQFATGTVAKPGDGPYAFASAIFSLAVALFAILVARSHFSSARLLKDTLRLDGDVLTVVRDGEESEYRWSARKTHSRKKSLMYFLGHHEELRSDQGTTYRLDRRLLVPKSGNH